MPVPQIFTLGAADWFMGLKLPVYGVLGKWCAIFLCREFAINSCYVFGVLFGGMGFEKMCLYIFG